MWANAQRDGRPAKHRWPPLFNAAKFGWHSLLDCHAVTLPRRETRWNLQGCPKLPNRSQPLVGRTSPYYKDMWRRYCCLTSFFPIVDTYLSCEDIAQQSCAMLLRWRFFASFLRPLCPVSRVQHISDLHSKFALRPHHVWKYGRHPLCDSFSLSNLSSLHVWGPRTSSNTWFLGHTPFHIQNSISISSAVFAQLMAEGPYTLQ